MLFICILLSLTIVNSFSFDYIEYQARCNDGHQPNQCGGNCGAFLIEQSSLKDFLVFLW